jgi:hypothetical protein
VWPELEPEIDGNVPNRKSFIVDIFFNLTMFFNFFFHLLCIFIYLKHIDYNKMSKYIQKVERCSFLISRSVKCVARTGNLLLLISSLILRCFAKTFFIYCVFLYTWNTEYSKMSKYIQKVERYSFLISRSVKCVTRTTKVDYSVLSEPEIFSFNTRFLRVFLHLKRINHNNFY